MQEDFQYYPTPSALASRAWAKFKNRDFVRVLEPSAGEGHLAEAMPDKSWNRSHRVVDCIEIDITRHAALRVLGYEVVGIDFMQLADASVYSHIIMNPPFAYGAEHVIKAWEVLYDGEIVAIINAETVRNPFSRERQTLARLIELHGSVEYISDAFIGGDVERETGVEVALIHLKKESNFGVDMSSVLDDLRRDTMTKSGLAGEFREANEVMLPSSTVENAVVVFNAAVRMARQAVFFDARAVYYEKLLGEPIETINAGGSTTSVNHSLGHVRSEMHKRYRELKSRAWSGILRSTQVTSRLSSAAQRRLESEFDDIKCLEFTVTNIYGFLSGLVSKSGEIQTEMVCDVFSLITQYHADNTVHYMGWKSNSRHRTSGMRIKMTRFVIPGHRTESWNRGLNWDSRQMLRDFDKVFTMLDGKVEPETSLEWVFENQFEALRTGERMSSSYFDVRYYPGIGTIHFFPRDKRLIDRFNRFVGRHRQWLPPEGEKVSDAFWLQYDSAEKMDKEVRQEANKLNANRWNDPFTKVSSRDQENQCEGHQAIGTAIANVLDRHGINVDLMLSGEEQLKLCA